MRLPILHLSLLLVLVAAGCDGRSAYETRPRGDELATTPGFSEEVEAVLRSKAELVEELAAEPKVIDAVKASNEEHKDTTTSEILRLDEKWRATEGLDDFIKAFMTNACAQLFMNFQDANDGFSEVFVTDEHGLIVAETNKTSDYHQADEDWWVDAYNDGAGKSYHGLIEYDESAMSESISVYVPVRDPETGKAIGVIKAVCDITIIKMEL
jgi:hypothetical protein